MYECHEWHNIWLQWKLHNSVAPKTGLDYSKPECKPNYISCTVKNQGSGSAASSYINYYLSSNTTYDPVDTYFTSDYVSSLSSGGTSSESATVTIPSGTSTGTKYILFYADKDGAVSESVQFQRVMKVIMLPIKLLLLLRHFQPLQHYHLLLTAVHCRMAPI